MSYHHTPPAPECPIKHRSYAPHTLRLHRRKDCRTWAGEHELGGSVWECQNTEQRWFQLDGKVLVHIQKPRWGWKD
jgi:hypothetical protein